VQKVFHYLETFRRDTRVWQTDGQQTDRRSDSKCRVLQRCAAKNWRFHSGTVPSNMLHYITVMVCTTSQPPEAKIEISE